MITCVTNSETHLILENDARTPSVTPKSVEGQQRYDFKTIKIFVPKSTLAILTQTDVVYLKDRSELYQLDYEELGYNSQYDLIEDLLSFLNDQTGLVTPTFKLPPETNETDMHLHSILVELQQINESLKLIVS